MRTAIPSNIRADFITAINETKATYAAVEAATGPTAADEKRVAETTLLAAAAFWESFLSDLVVAYVNVDASGLKAHIESRYSASARKNEKDEAVMRASSYVSPVMNQHLKLDEVSAILARKGQNVTFGSAQHMKTKASDWLCAGHAAHFAAVSGPQVATMDAWRAIRNFVAHRNMAARKRMNEKLLDADLPATLQRGASKVHSPGKYLRAKSGGTRRLEIYLDAMVNIAQVLCP